MKTKYIAFIAAFAVITVGCFQKHENVPDEVVEFAIKNFENAVFFGDIDSTFNSTREYNTTMRVDSVRSIEVDTRILNDYYLLEFTVSGTLYENFDPLPYEVYQGDRALYTIFDYKREPSSEVRRTLTDKGILRPYNRNPRRYLEENINVYYYYICKDDIHKFQRHVSDIAMRDADHPKSICH